MASGALHVDFGNIKVGYLKLSSPLTVKDYIKYILTEDPIFSTTEETVLFISAYNTLIPITSCLPLAT